MNLHSEIKSIYFRRFARGVINPVARLHVIAVDVEIDALALIRQGVRLDADTTDNQFAVTEIGGHLVVDTPTAGKDEVAHLHLIGQHSLDVHVAGSRNQIALLGVQAGQAPRYQVATVVQVLSVKGIIANRVPTGGSHHSNRAALLPSCGSRLEGDDHLHGAASTGRIEIREDWIGGCRFSRENGVPTVFSEYNDQATENIYEIMGPGNLEDQRF